MTKTWAQTTVACLSDLKKAEGGPGLKIPDGGDGIEEDFSGMFY